jgi:hypothetical protein
MCRASVPVEFSDELFLENSLDDANAITISRSETEICYPNKPNKGKAENMVGLKPKTCAFSQSRFELEELGERKTDIEATLAYKIKYQPFTLYPDPDLETSTTEALGKLYLDRGTNACTFEMFRSEGKQSAWGGKKLIGVLECSTERKFYFNPWSWFPQTVGLFYTRIFYAIHRPS